MGSATTTGCNYLRLGMIACEDLPKWGGKDCAKLAARIFGERGLGQQHEQAIECTSTAVRSNNTATTASEFSSPFIEWEYFDAVSGGLPAFDNLRDYHGFVLTGSHYSVNDNSKWITRYEEWIRGVKKFQENNDNSPRIVATCFSHQLLCKAFGGTVGKNPHGKFVWNRESVTLMKEAKDHPFFKNRYNNTEGISYSLYESHGDCILELPAEAKCLGKSESCNYEVVSYGDDIITIQSHPEFSEHEMATLILPALKKSNLISDSEADKEMEMFKTKTDGKAIMKLIEKYFLRVL